jgi:hypothetical protein
MPGELVPRVLRLFVVEDDSEARAERGPPFWLDLA